MRKQRVVLEHHVGGTTIGSRIRDVDAIDQDPTVRRFFESAEHAQRRGLAAARRPQEGDELALGDRQGHARYRGETVAVSFAEPLDLNQRGPGRGLRACNNRMRGLADRRG